MDTSEKYEELKETNTSAEEKIEKTKRKRESWREWREPKNNLQPPTPPSRKRKLETLDESTPPTGGGDSQKRLKNHIGRGGSDPVMKSPH